jgi:hypothetical protein
VGPPIGSRSFAGSERPTLAHVQDGCETSGTTGSLVPIGRAIRPIGCLHLGARHTRATGSDDPCEAATQSNRVVLSISPDRAEVQPTRPPRNRPNDTSRDIGANHTRSVRQLLAEYQEKRNATRDELAQLPDGDRIRAFDVYRTRILALPDAIGAASPARLEELCRIVLRQVVVADRQLKTIEWVPAARPFFEKQRECPQGDSNP